ncbi:2521_t:CDS:2, partial [Funneliformis mosseae]
QPPDVVERRVTITGQPDDVKTARSMIQQLVEDASNGTLTSRRDSHSGGNRTTITIHIPVNKVGVVIGRGGETIRDLQDRSGARINVTPDSAASPQSNDRPVTLIGDETAVQRAKALIDEIVNTGESSSDRNHPKDYRSNNYGNNYNNTDNNHHGNGYSGGHYGSNHGQYNHHSGKSSQDSITIQVPNDSVGLIIGKGGETVRALQQQSGAKIQIEPVHGVPPVDRNVQIIGTAENIAIAKSLILEKAASGNRERQSRHNNDQGRNDYGSSGYQQSGYQQSGYQQSGYQQSGYQQGSYQQSSYPQSSYSPSSGYQQGGVSSANSTASGYPSANTYGVAGQQPQTAYSQYGQYGTAQAATPYSQYPTQTQYGAYGQTTQYSQSTPGQPVGQPTIQPVIQPVIQAVNNQPTGQPSVQPQVGYYSAQTTTMDPNKIGSGNEIKSDVQAVSATPNYAYQQYGYNYGTPTSNQYPTVATGQIQTAAVSQAAGGYPLLGATATAYGTPTAINT